jgi:4-hydroxybenzoate polyprenyltransferase
MSAMAAIRTWAEMVKFSHSVFALPFALIATFLAASAGSAAAPTAGQLGLIVSCMVAGRSFAMTFNRIADAAIDARNPRTALRPLPAGRLTTRQAVVGSAIAASVFVASCWGFARAFGNFIPLCLSLPTLAALAGYSYAKRVTRLSHFVLGAVIGFAPVAAWIAIDPASVGVPAVLLGGAVCFWIAGFDVIYACQDVDVDRREGLHSLPARWGVARALWIARVCHLATAALLIALGTAAHLGPIYWGALTVTCALLAAEHSVVRADDLSRVNLAFFTLNGCISLLLGSAAITDVLLN